MKKAFQIKPFFLFLLFLYGIMLYFFYVKYIPLVKPFQSILLPVLFFVFVLAAVEIKWGILLFIFTFPLINNLPYFFNIHENTPHAPTALVLFLFFFMGWLVHFALDKKPDAFRHRIFRPLVLFSLLVLVSAVITFFRYANFFPFFADSIYELQTNAYGVSAGGAIMSVVFNSLNYWTGLAFFFILVKTVDSREFIRKILVVLCASTFLSLLFGMYQHFKDIKFGNNPVSINQALINATFKDGLSFGAYIAIITSLILGAAFGLKGFMRIVSLLVVILSLFMILLTGSKSGLFCLLLSLLVFTVFSIRKAYKSKKIKAYSFKQIITSLSFVVIFIGLGAVGFFTFKEPIVTKITESRTFVRANVLRKQLEKKSEFNVFKRRSERLWKLAIPMIKEYPLTGVGIGGYIIEVSNYAKIFETRIGTPESAENYFLQVGSELGLIGLLLVLWIFWEIIWQMKRNHRKIPDDDRYKFILIGAAAGIIAFLINIQVHTYIGSYEIKYAFWLLVGLLFAMGRDAGEIAEEGRGIKEIVGKVLFSRKFKTAGGILLVLLGAVHLWNSTHSLSLAARTEKLDLKQDFGFYQQEKTNDDREFRWTREYGGTTLTVEKPVIEIPVLASHPDIENKPVNLKIFLVKDFFKQKKLLDKITLTRNVWKTYAYSVPEEVGQEVILLFKVSRTWNPLKVTGAHDPRNLGVAIGKIQFKER
ncbi:O-antigen ligase family protein [Acidobacteriota bacterium]